MAMLADITSHASISKTSRACPTSSQCYANMEDKDITPLEKAVTWNSTSKVAMEETQLELAKELSPTDKKEFERGPLGATETWTSSTTLTSDKIQPDSSGLKDGDLEKAQMTAAKFSKWGVGRKTPTIMIFSYICALVIASIHLGLFIYLDGKSAESSNASIQAQSYVSVTSNILANLFGIALSGSIGIVFTQYLWYLLRKHPWKISSIESMFSMQTNPLEMRHSDIMFGAPLLGLLAIFIWAINIVANFAPGALIVGLIVQYSNQTSEVPTFNSTFVGNGSGFDANLFSLDPFQPSQSTFTPDSQWGTYSRTLARLSAKTMITGTPSTMSSPCGANCSYTLSFEAPYLKCSPLNITYALGSQDLFSVLGQGAFRIFEGRAFDPYLTDLWPASNTTFSIPPSEFKFKTYDVVAEELNSYDGSDIANRINSLSCRPASTEYTISYNFTNNVLLRNVTRGSVRSITNLAAPVQDENGIYFPGFVNNETVMNEIQFDFGMLGYEALNWTSSWLSWYSNLQTMAVINSVALALNGSYLASPDYYTNNTGTLPSSWGLGNGIWYTDLQWVDDANGFPSDSLTNQYQRSTIAAYTRLNDNFNQFNQTQLEEEIGWGFQNYPISFTISEELLNEFLLNTTLSMISDIGWWTTPTIVTTWTPINSFLFSQPLHLVLPYGLSLLLTLPLLALGMWSLRRNGISAMNNSFLQIATSTTGSKELEKALAGSCLGGDGNATKELGELRVRFGELEKSVYNTNEDENGGKAQDYVRRAGFGVEKEVKPLVKGGLYGVV